MRFSEKNMAYRAPQAEIIVIQAESYFMSGDTPDSKSFSSSFDFEDKNGVEEGEAI